jgi:hypothetical protein
MWRIDFSIQPLQPSTRFGLSEEIAPALAPDASASAGGDAHQQATRISKQRASASNAYQQATRISER